MKWEECGSGFRYFLYNFSDGGRKIAVKNSHLVQAVSLKPLEYEPEA